MSLEEVLFHWGAVETDAMTVYSDIFHLGAHYLQENHEAGGRFKANPVGYFKNRGDAGGHFRIFFEDTFAETLHELQDADFAILGGLTYYGRRNVMDRASKMYAMIFDIDGVTDSSLNAFMSGSIHADVYPLPNYVVLSGNGIHLYYIFEEPISLYPNIKLQLKQLKYALIDKMWNQYTSVCEQKQYQGINQGFRPIGGKSKIPGVVVRAFRVNNHPVSLAELSRYVPEQFRVDEEQRWKESLISIDEAKTLWPEWYEKVVLLKDTTPNYWDLSQKVHGEDPYAIYHWWIRKIREGATYGHRYYSIMCLAIYASKCRVPYDQLEKDALALQPFLNSLNPDMPFRKSDVQSALECYDLRYCTFPRRDIEKLSGIEIPANKRNYRTREDHLKYMRGLKALKSSLGEDVVGGRPNKKELVREYRQQHPDISNKSQVARDLGISVKTVAKWWDSAPQAE